MNPPLLFSFIQDKEPEKQTSSDPLGQDVIQNLLPEGSPPWARAAMEYGVPIAFGAIKVIVILLITWIIAGIVGRIVLRALEKAKLDVTLSKFFGKMARWVVILLGILACLSIFGIETTSFAAVLGAAGLAIGLAFQGSLSNFASGIMLLIFRPFKIGQFIKVSGEAGTVNEIDLFTTTLDTPDNRRIIIPNGTIFSSTIENVSHHTKRRVDVNVGTAYEADLDQTRQLLMDILKTLPETIQDPEPVVMLQELGASSIDWQLRVWCKPDDYWNVRQELMRSIKYKLDQAGIGIPYPQMDVHLDSPNAA